jgi:energy-coupling factor transporter transmembrane protein EcfT
MAVDIFFLDQTESYLSRHNHWFLLIEIALLSAAITVSVFPYSLIISLYLCGYLVSAGINLKDALLEIKKFWILFILIGAAPIINIGISYNGFAAGIITIFKFIHYILLGMLVLRILKPVKFQAVSYRLLACVPFVDAAKGAAIVRIVFSLIPVLFATMQQMHCARLSRCFMMNKNPLYRAYYQSVSLAAYFIVNAVHFSEALESRNFDYKVINSDRNRVTYFDFVLLGITVIVCLMGNLFYFISRIF